MSDKPFRILYISQYFPPEMGAPSARVHELSRRWVERGAAVTVLTAFPNHPDGIIPKEYRGKVFMREEKDSIQVVRTFIYPAANRGFLRRSLSYISFLFSSIIQGAANIKKPDIIVATSPQFFVVIAGYLMSKIKNVPFVFELRDFWPESIVQLGLLKNRFLIRMLETIEMFLYKKAARIVGVVDSFKDVLVSRGIPLEKIKIIKNGVDLKLFNNPFNQIELKRKHNLADKFIVGYIGTHGMAHALDKVLDAAALLRENNNIHFLFVGDGAEKDNLVKQKTELSLDNVTFQEKALKEQVPELYALADVLLVTLRKIDLFKNALPSKLFEIMAMGKPILLMVDGEARAFVEEVDAGLYVEPENSAQLAEKIRDLLGHPEEARRLGQNGKTFVHKHFNRNHLADKYLVILKKIA